MTRTILGCALGGITITAIAAYLWLIGYAPQFEDRLYQWK